MDFEIVDNSRRSEKRHQTSALWDALRAGQTVFLPGAIRQRYQGFYTMFRIQGYRLRIKTEKDPPGVVLWAERIE